MGPSRSDSQARLAVKSPSSKSLAVPVKVMLSSSVNVEPLAGALIITDGVWLPDSVYSTCSKGAAAAAPSQASATRSPVPVMMMASELPLAQPGRLTISCMTEAMSGVCWSGPASPFVVQGGGDQETVAAVAGREEIFPPDEVNVAALSTSSP